MKNLTVKQFDKYTAIRKFYVKHNRLPTKKEMTDLLNVPMNTAEYYMYKLWDYLIKLK